MLAYDSMRVRDDLRQSGDNVFWVREIDVLEVERQRDKLRHHLETMLQEATDIYSDNAQKARAALEEINNG